MSEADLIRARAEAAAAKERLLNSAQALQARLKPGALASDAWEKTRDVGEAAAGSAVRTISNRPVAASAAVIGVVALVARKPIARLIAKLRGKDQ